MTLAARNLPLTEEQPSFQASGAEIVIRALEEEGVDTVFGYPGGAVLPLYDALYFSKVRHILVRHEQGAAHAADGYARATGKVGVCFATSGPGATNLVTGLANAYMDSIPLVAFTGQVSLELLGRDSFQEADTTGITMPITKHNFLVKRPEDLAVTVHKAFYLARTGRPGPVLIDLPKDVTARVITYSNSCREVDIPGYHPRVTPEAGAVARVVEALSRARRPVIYAGGGVLSAEATAELLVLVERTGVPVVTSLMGKGVIPEDHPLALGMLGMHGTAYANLAVSECDLLLALGTRFSDRSTGRFETFAPHAKVVHVDIDAAEIGKNVRVDIGVVGDLKSVLEALLSDLEKAPEVQAWQRQIAHWREAYPLRYECPEGVIKPQFVVEQICELTRGEAVITTDVGQNQMWAAQYYRCRRPRSFLSSGGLGTMGFGLPAAIGAQIGRPGETVIDIAGDGSLQMTVQELATVAQYQLPIKICLLNNGYLGMVRQWQELFYEHRYSQVDISQGGPDYVKLAEAYGITARRVTRPEEVRPALEAALSEPKPYLLDFVVDREENVFPMVPPGGSLDQMLGGKSVEAHAKRTG
ncbi:MAG: biosynthetic-type acetolactate synthase large subunit [Clostridia bacterium]|jgi:acetolactate synthase-1/2/3 large subunit|nr:biosynthetic-type acetolactate synthase large subunit [Clostridia bacterium]MDH7572049.1 biosynthetic-type acetolactate synthase large subunit [Clostridia bacterium]